MKDNNLISVIVVTYNQQDSIARTLDSILMQKCRLPIEIVVGDDASTDSTRAICEDYVRRYPDIVRLMPAAPNKGVVDNYFDCLLACRGKYIADCAGDDYWIDPLKLDKEVEIIEADPSVTIVHTNWRTYNEDTHETKDNSVVYFPTTKMDGKQMLEAIVTQTNAPVVHLCTALYRAETIKRCYDANTDLFRNKDLGCEDLQIVFMLALNGTVAYLPDVTMTYSIGKPSVSHQANHAKQFRFVRQTTMLSWRLANLAGIDTEQTRRFFSLRVYELLMHAFRSGDAKLKVIALECMSTWNVKPDKRIKTALAVMSNAVLWNVMLCVRGVFVVFKRLLLFRIYVRRLGAMLRG